MCRGQVFTHDNKKVLLRGCKWRTAHGISCTWYFLAEGRGYPCPGSVQGEGVPLSWSFPWRRATPVLALSRGGGGLPQSGPRTADEGSNLSQSTNVVKPVMPISIIANFGYCVKNSTFLISK